MVLVVHAGCVDDSADGSTGTDAAGGSTADAGEPGKDAAQRPEDAAADGLEDAAPPRPVDGGHDDVSWPADTAGPRPVDGGPPQDDSGEVPDERHLTVPAAGALAIDGDLGDWPAAGCVSVDAADWVALAGVAGDDADLSARVCLAWSARRLFLAAVVTDDVHSGAASAEALWQADSLQLALDVDGDRTSGAYDLDGDYEYGFGLLGAGAAVWRWHSPVGVSQGAEVAVVRAGRTTTYEAALPLVDLAGLEGRSGETFGWTFLVNDDDGQGREGWVQWTPGIGRGKDPSAFGTARLDGAPGPDPEPEPEVEPGLDSPYGINAHLPRGADLVALYDKVQAAGIAWVRADFVWFVAQPEPGRWDWSVFDGVARAAEARGLHVYASLAAPPAWANAGQHRDAPTRPDEWREFCRRVAERYDGHHDLPRIDHLGVWNEPDHEMFFSGTVDEYVRDVLRPCADGIRAGNPQAKVLGPDLAHDREFLADVLEQAADVFDIVTLHRYGRRVGDVMERFDGSHWPWEDLNYQEILEHAGVLPGRPVWLTEAGWPTPVDGYCWFEDGIQSEQGQADRYRELLDALSRRPWIEKVFFYELKDADLPDICQWGILAGDRREKPAYGAYRDWIRTH